MSFELHPTLEKDCYAIGEWPLCRVLLMDDARFAWLILVPRVNDIREMHDLTAPERMQLMEEITQASHALQLHSEADKINVAALGNQVPQLHIHIIARYKDDDAWPNPVWSARSKRLAYTQDKAAKMTAKFQEILVLPV